MTPSTSADSGLATLLAVQRKAFQAEGPPSAEERRADLTALHGLLVDNRRAIAKALREDFGARSAYETEIADLTPAIGELFARLVADRFSPEKIVVVNGGMEVSQEFAALPFDHLLFTGSTAVGRHIMRAAAENLTPVTLELGGKSPVIIGEDYPLARAAQRIVGGKLFNSGQICIAPDYVMVPEGKEREFAAYAQAAARKLYPKLAGNDDYTAAINDKHYQHLTDTIADAPAKGAVI